jgi:hypothetical protein
MQIPVLIQPIEGGRFRARAGEPFAMTVEAASPEEATATLAKQLEECFRAGAALTVIHVNNGNASAPAVHFDFTPLADDDWFFQTMRDAIAENRAREETSP